MTIRTLIGGSFECTDCGDIRGIPDLLISDDGKDSLCPTCYKERREVATATEEQEQDNA